MTQAYEIQPAVQSRVHASVDWFVVRFNDVSATKEIDKAGKQ